MGIFAGCSSVTAGVSREPHNAAGYKDTRKVTISSDLGDAVRGHDLLVSAVPSQAVRSVAMRLADFDLAGVVIVSATKGIEDNTLFRMSQVFQDVLSTLSNDQFVVLSGPSHAEEVSREIPTTIVAACSKIENAELIQDVFMTPTFRVYSHTDVIGVEIGGSLKNIIAIAAGIIDGVGFGDNTKAALITRGLAEMTRLGTAMGADPLTFAGLSGVGDLVVTCMSRHSRNRHVGEEIGKGKSLEEILSKMVMVAEGVATTRAAIRLAEFHRIEMPIARSIYQVLFDGKNPKQAVYDLMSRDAKEERFGS